MSASIQAWIIDVYVVGSILLSAAGLAAWRLKQPARRMAVCRAALAGALALSVCAALPAWPRISWRVEAQTPAPPLADSFDPVAPRPIHRPPPTTPLRLPRGQAERVAIPAVLTAGTPEPAIHTSNQFSASWRGAWTTAFACGALAGLWVGLGGLLASLARRGMREAPEPLRNLLSGVVGRGHWRPDLRISPRIGQPMALGVLRPTIILPESLAFGEPDRRIEAILAHEWAHIRNGDLWLLALIRLLLPLWFAHPAYWWIRRQIRADQEVLADVAATRDEDPIAYAEILLHWARTAPSRPRQPFAGALALWERPSQLRRRITMLLDRERRVETTCPRGWRLGVPGFTVAAVLALSVLTLRTTPRAVADAPKAPASPGETVTFQGRVLGPEGRPATGAIVALLATPPPKDTKAARAEADAEGRYRVTIPRKEFDAIVASGRWSSVTLVATAPGLGLDWASLRRIQDGDLDLRLVRDDVPIEGRLLDLEGRPVVGAKVSRGVIHAEVGEDIAPYLKLVAEDPSTASSHMFARSFPADLSVPGLPNSASTDAEGRFRLSGIGRDRIVDLSVEAPAVQSAAIMVMTRDTKLIAGAQSGLPRKAIHGARFDLLIPPGRALTGVVRDKVTRKPIAGVWVAGTETSSRAITDVEGRYTLPGFPKGKSYGLIVGAGEAPPYFVTCLRVSDTPGLAPIVTDVNCERGIPMRLRLVEKETGRPVTGAEVSYRPIYPNPHVGEHSGFAPVNMSGPFNSGAEGPDGTYELGVLPGPGGVFVRTAEGLYRPACVDPKVFFRAAAGGKPDGALYGDRDSIHIPGGAAFNAMPQDQFGGIFLTNPPEDSGPLSAELTLERDRGLDVRVVDPNGKPLDGVTADGAQAGAGPGVLRVFKLNPLRPSRVVFRQDEKKLVGFLLARGDEPQPCTVSLKPWGTIVGRLVDPQGRPRPGVDLVTLNWQQVIDDPSHGILGGLRTDPNGRFRIDALVPGQKHSANAVGMKAIEDGSGVVIDDVVLGPGEVRDLGDVQARETPREEGRR